MRVEYPEELLFLVQSSARYKILYGGRGGMKCLALGTKVIMYDGSLRKVEDVKENDLLMGPDSKPRQVYGITRGFSQMYKVKQTSAIDYIVNSSHILSLKKSESAITDGRYKDYKKITNINVVEAYKNSNRWKEHFRGYKAGLVKFDEKEVTINPWYLGLWLGDGKSNDLIVYTGDEEVLKEVEDYANSLDMRIAIYEEKSKCVGVAIRRSFGKDGRINVLWQNFIYYNLINNKHIPLDFLSNSEKNRLELLAGLIDSDGTIHNNGYTISQTNEQLAKDIKYLADTLGFRTSLNKRATKCSYKGKDVIGETFWISINGDTWRIPCRVVRKQIKKENIRKNKDFLLSQIEIEPVGIGEYVGFSLGGDHLFLLEDGTVTHNTESIALALISLACQSKLRIACFREIQKSIEESVYQTIVNRIHDMGLTNQFDIQAKSIICKITGAEFIFFGLRYNINSIKSIARIDIAWIEEAVNVSKTSWDKLTPTIRGRGKNVILENIDQNKGGPFGKGTEIWVSFNPELDTDETYKRFILNREAYAPDFITNEIGEKIRYAHVKMLSYKDNPWLPDDLRIESELLKQSDEDEWLHVWGGQTRQTLTGAIYAKEIKKVLLEGRRTTIKYDSSRPVYTFWDLGHADHTAIWFIQRTGVEYNIIDYYQNQLEKFPHYIEKLQELKYNYGMHYLPHDAENEQLAAERSIKRQLQAAYPDKVKIVPRVAKKFHGIQAARAVFDLCNFDEENTADGWQCLCRYCYKVTEDGKWSREPEHDTPWSHGADAWQTFALSLKSEIATKKKKVISTKVVNIRSSVGWMR